jgi:enolase-phosphatase E1
VRPAFERWRASGLEIYIYSSGSVLAQQLLFGSTDAGDLTALVKGYFDTTVGPKTAFESYITIAARIREVPPEIAFVSDVVEELDAARRAGLQTVLCARAGGDAHLRSSLHPIIHSFDDISD